MSACTKIGFDILRLNYFMTYNEAFDIDCLIIIAIGQLIKAVYV